jgi:hypothetical protein
MKKNWNTIINGLVLVKIGQDLGTDCKFTQTLHDAIEIIASFFSAIAHL